MDQVIGFVGKPALARSSRSTPRKPALAAAARVSSNGAGTLFLVSTPIGNLGDMSHRAVEVLSSAALVIAEDTRHSRRLLDHYAISTPLSSYHEHNEAKETPRLVARLKRGDSIALISDAGTPLISDPGPDCERSIEGEFRGPVPCASSVMAAPGTGLPLTGSLSSGSSRARVRSAPRRSMKSRSRASPAWFSRRQIGSPTHCRRSPRREPEDERPSSRASSRSSSRNSAAARSTSW